MFLFFVTFFLTLIIEALPSIAWQKLRLLKVKTPLSHILLRGVVKHGLGTVSECQYEGN